MVQLLVSLVLCFATSNLIAADVKVGGVHLKTQRTLILQQS